MKSSVFPLNHVYKGGISWLFMFYHLLSLMTNKIDLWRKAPSFMFMALLSGPMSMSSSWKFLTSYFLIFLFSFFFFLFSPPALFFSGFSFLPPLPLLLKFVWINTLHDLWEYVHQHLYHIVYSIVCPLGRQVNYYGSLLFSAILACYHSWIFVTSKENHSFICGSILNSGESIEYLVYFHWNF